MSTGDENEHGRRRGAGDDGRVLWGRVIVLGLALVLMFFLGRCTAGADSTDEQEVERLESRVEELEQENLHLQEELEAVGAGGTETDADDDDEPDEDEDGDGDGEDGDEDGEDEGAQEDSAEGASDDGSSDGEGSSGGRTHEVQAGESLYRLAERYYDDGDLFRVIARANDLRTDEPLQPGQTLEIPSDPDA